MADSRIADTHLKNILLLEENISGEDFIIKDIRGNMARFEYLIENLIPNSSNRIFFIGDLTYEGRYSLDIVETFSTYKRQYPDRIFFQRGPHEDLCLKAIDSFEKILIAIPVDSHPTEENIKIFNECNEKKINMLSSYIEKNHGQWLYDLIQEELKDNIIIINDDGKVTYKESTTALEESETALVKKFMTDLPDGIDIKGKKALTLIETIAFNDAELLTSPEKNLDLITDIEKCFNENSTPDPFSIVTDTGDDILTYKENHENNTIENNDTHTDPNDILVLEENTLGNDFIVGDIHENFRAFSAFFENATKKNPHNRFFFVGNLFGEKSDSQIISLILDYEREHPHHIFITAADVENLCLKTITSFEELLLAVPLQQSENNPTTLPTKKELDDFYEINEKSVRKINHYIDNNNGKWLCDLMKKEEIEEKINIDPIDNSNVIYTTNSEIGFIKNFIRHLPCIIHVKSDDEKNSFNVVHAAMPFTHDELNNRLQKNQYTMNAHEKEIAIQPSGCLNKKNDDPSTYTAHFINKHNNAYYDHTNKDFVEISPFISPAVSPFISPVIPRNNRKLIPQFVSSFFTPTSSPLSSPSISPSSSPFGSPTTRKKGEKAGASLPSSLLLEENTNKKCTDSISNNNNTHRKS